MCVHTPRAGKEGSVLYEERWKHRYYNNREEAAVCSLLFQLLEDKELLYVCAVNGELERH